MWLALDIIGRAYIPILENALAVKWSCRNFEKLASTLPTLDEGTVLQRMSTLEAVDRSLHQKQLHTACDDCCHENALDGPRLRCCSSPIKVACRCAWAETSANQGSLLHNYFLFRHGPCRRLIHLDVVVVVVVTAVYNDVLVQFICGITTMDTNKAQRVQVGG